MMLVRVALGLVLIAPPVITHAGTVDQTDVIEEIVISAEKWRRTLRDSTASVVVITADALTWATELDHVEILQRIPNVTVDPLDGRVGFREMADRGFGGFGTNSNMQLDGATYTPYFISDVRFPLWDVEQMEILRGAQTGAALFSATGVLAVVTRAPSFEHSGRAQLDVRDEGRREFGLAHGGPLIADQLAFRMALHTTRDPGVIENVTLADDEWRDQERHLIRTKLLYQPTWWQGSRILLTYQGQKDVLGADSPVINRVLARDGFDPFERQTAIDTREQRRNYFNITTLEIDHPVVAGWSANHLLSYQSRRFSQVSDFDGTAEAGTTLEERFRSNSIQFQTKASFEGLWKLELGASVIGFFPLENRLAFTRQIDLDGPGSLPGVDLVNTFGFDDDVWGAFLFGYASRTWNDSWTLDVGGRVLRGQIDSRRQVSFARGSDTGNSGLNGVYDSLIASLPALDDRAKPGDTRFLPMAALHYALTRNLTAGVRYEQGYRIGQTDINRAQATAVPYDSELSDHWGAFVRGVWFDGALSIAGDVFRIDFEDLQLRRCFSANSLDCNVVNAGTASSQGIELQLAYSPQENWNGWLGFGITDTSYAKVRAEIQEDPTQLARNDKTPWSVSSGFAYTTEAGLFATLDWTYRSVGAIALSDQGVVAAKSLSLMNARLGWRFDLRGRGAEISVYARNLLDEKYLTFADPALPSGVAQRAVVGDAAEWGLSLRTDW